MALLGRIESDGRGDKTLRKLGSGTIPGDPCAKYRFFLQHLRLIIYVGFCLALATASYLRPLPTFDRYLYAGAVASFRYSDPLTIHRTARAEFDAQPSPFRFESVAAEPYFADVYANPNHFAQQLGLFRVKLGYVAAGYLLWCTGLHILVGLRLISACCIFVVGLTVLAWTHDAVLSALLLLTPPVLSMGRMVTADPLSTTMVFLALFAVARGRDCLSASLLVASILVRSDNLVLAVILLAWMAWRRRIRFSHAALFEILVVAVAVLVNRISGVYGWRVIMQHGFVKPLIDPIGHPVLITFAGYLHALAELRAIPYTFMTIWVLVAVAIWKRLPSGSVFRDLLSLAGLYIVVRLAMFPNFDDRFFLWTYLLAAIALIQSDQVPASDVTEDAALPGFAGDCRRTYSKRFR
ncbi:MAG: hypothetical protein WBW03_31470 [Silvibacterium sp.]